MLLPAYPTRWKAAPGSRQHAVILDLVHKDVLQKAKKRKSNVVKHQDEKISSVYTHYSKPHLFPPKFNTGLSKYHEKCAAPASEIWLFYNVCQVLLLKRNMRRKHWLIRGRLNYLRWYEKSEWIFLALAKPAQEATWERRWARGLEVDYWFPFLFLGQRNGGLMGRDIYLDPFHSAIIRL